MSLRAVMEWDLINSSSSYLTDEIRQARFNFFGKTMSGRKEEYPLWKRATNEVENAMGEALGKMYCERYFPAFQQEDDGATGAQSAGEPRPAHRRTDMDERLYKAQRPCEGSTSSMSRLAIPISGPTTASLTIDPSKSYFDNVMATRLFAVNKMIADKAGKPVDRDEWFMTPQTVNAYYNPTTNEICFPAGILQRPFFDPKADAAFNYGAIGVVIGHEMTHGFDDQGRQYDADGNLHDWWTAADAKGFEQRARLYSDFFDAIEVLPGLHANGKFTLGENLADHGGLQVAFNAFKNATAAKPLKTVDGFTPEQRFFIAYAGVWGQNITEQEIRNRVKRDPHALGEWRVNGALPHIDAWYKAFNVKPGDKMYIPEQQRLQLW